MFNTTQNHWKPFNTIEHKKADFSVLWRLFKTIQKHLKSAKVERVARIELAQPGRKHGILPLNYTRNLYLILYLKKQNNSSLIANNCKQKSHHTRLF